jgi:mRNA-degrading endonuclease RelE of RelBE toxin-antitoxin system
MFKVELSDSALDDLKTLKKNEQVLVLDSVEKSLSHEPMSETRQRKPLGPNPIAQWELRIDCFRVFYDVYPESQAVLIKAVGWKDHDILFIRGREYQL